jgi:mRNA interferase MazF
MKEGDILITSFPQADGKVKSRPALLLRKMPGYGDYLVCGISSQIHQYIEGFDNIISPEDDDYNETGLICKSVVRVGFLSVLPQQKIIGSIGSISSMRRMRIIKQLCDYLIKLG